MFDLLRGRGRLDKTVIALVYLFNLMTTIGIHRPQRFRLFYAIYSPFFKFMLCIAIPFLFNFGYILDAKNMTSSQLLTAMQMGINILGIPPKVLAIIINQNRFRRAEVLLTELDARCQSPFELLKIRRAVFMGNCIVTLFSICYFTYGVSQFISSIAMGSPAFQLYLPFLSWRESLTDYLLQVLIEMILFSMLALCEVVSDAYPVIYIYLVRSHTQILTERVRNLGTQPEKSLEANYRELVQCIVDHKVLLELHETIGWVTSITIFVQFLITALMLCCTMVNIFLFADNTPTRIACVFYCLSVNMQVFPCCHQATSLMEDSERLTLAIFHCNWMNQDVRFRKMILFFMHRSQNPMELTAIKLFPINLRTNLSIVKFSFSLYTLMKHMDFGKKNG